MEQVFQPVRHCRPDRQPGDGGRGLKTTLVAIREKAFRQRGQCDAISRRKAHVPIQTPARVKQGSAIPGIQNGTGGVSVAGELQGQNTERCARVDQRIGVGPHGFAEHQREQTQHNQAESAL